MQNTDAVAQVPNAQTDNPLDEYFARQPADRLIGELQKRSTNQWNALQNRGLPTLWRLSYAQAFGMDPETYRNATQRLEFCGSQQQFIRFRVQLARGHVKQRNQLAQGQRPSFTAVATNDDASSLAQTGIAGKILTYLFREANGEAACYEALESDGYFGEGLIWCRWDDDAGDSETVVEMKPANDQFTGQPLLELDGSPTMKPVSSKKRVGSISYTSLYPWDVTRDTNTRRPSWIEIREKASKFELMARYPEKAEAISRLALVRDNEPGVSEMFQWDFTAVTDDTLLVKHFYHKACDAVPGGRYVGYVGDVVLWDDPCPIEDGLPVISICSARYFGTQMGYPEATDLLSVQEMIDELLSQGATNALKFGNQSLWGEDGIEFDQQAFMQGGAFFTLKQGQKPPQVIDWAPMPEFTKYMLEKLPEFMDLISGMNGVVRGQPDANITSGVFASLMQSIAEKFISATQASYDFALNEVGNVSLELVRANSDTRFAANVSGEANAPYMSYFTAKDLSGVKKVLIQRQSPVMNSIGGRFEVFEKTKDLPKDQRQAAIQMLQTGDSSAWTENDDACLILIRKENEMLAKGQAPQVSKTDDHKLHGYKHCASLDRLRAQDPPQQQQALMQWQAAIKAHVDHLGQHAVTWSQTDPVFAAMLNLPQPPVPDPVGGGLVPHPNLPPPQPHPALPQSGPPGRGGPPGGGPTSMPKAAPQLPARPGIPGAPNGQQAPQPAAAAGPANGGGPQ